MSSHYINEPHEFHVYIYLKQNKTYLPAYNQCANFNQNCLTRSRVANNEEPKASRNHTPVSKLCHR